MYVLDTPINIQLVEILSTGISTYMKIFEYSKQKMALLGNTKQLACKCDKI